MEEFLTYTRNVMGNSVAKSSKTQYDRAWREWNAFCIRFAIEPLGKTINIKR